MAFCNAVRKVSNWKAVGTPLADMLLLLRWTMHFVLWERDLVHSIRVWIPTYPIQMNASYISKYCVTSQHW
jgi:hypothetical protein